MEEGFVPVRAHPALIHASSSFKIRSNTKKDKKRLVPIDLASTASYKDLGNVLNEPATTPSQEALMLECEHKVGLNYGERIINVRSPTSGAPVRVVDVLQAIHDFLYEKAPASSVHSGNDLLRIEKAHEERQTREETDHTLHVANDIERPVIVVSAPDGNRTVESRDWQRHSEGFVKMDLLCGRSCFMGLSRSSGHDFKLVFKLAANLQP